MTPEQWHEIKSALAAAQSLEGEARAAHLAVLEPGVRAEVEALLAADELHAGGLEVGALPSGVATEAWVGRRLGPYEVTGVLGEGGMGVVYRARRADGAFERDVAVKVLRRSLLSPQFLERFQLERQILARLEHPAIARLLDGGRTAEGDPWLAMELVEGTRIDHYCAQQALPQERRIALFREACAAVQYAHANLVVHRDLKPGNILVDGDGHPKLLDFGIARPLDDAGPEQTRHTALPVMTLEYASPEQLRGERVTTASDVYSLGVILYVLLTGRHPYRTRDASSPELIRAISEGDAQRTGLGADLDAIVLKAMRREPGERYATPERLADDLRRYVEGLPVTARPGTRGYLVRKFVRRHALGVGLAAAAAIVLVGGLVAITLLDGRLRTSARQTESALAEAKAVADFLEQDMLGAADPRRTERSDLPVRDVLAAASRRVDARFAGQPLLAAAVHRALGQSWAGSGDLAQADKEYGAALALLAGRDDPRSRALRLQILNDNAQDHYIREDFDGAARLLEPTRRSTGAAASAEERDQRWITRVIEGGLLMHRGHGSEGLAQLEAVVAEVVKAKGPRDPVALRARYALSNNLLDSGNLERGEQVLRALASDVAIDESGTVSGMAVREDLAFTLGLRGRLAEALAIAEPLYAKEVQLFGEADGRAMDTGSTLASAYGNSGQSEKSEALYGRLIAVGMKAYGPDSSKVLDTRGDLAVQLRQSGRCAEAVELERGTLAAYERIGQGATRPAIMSWHNLNHCLEDLGRWQEAAKGVATSIALARDSLTANDAANDLLQTDLADLALHEGRRDEAVRILDAVTPRLIRQYSSSHSSVQRAQALRAQAGSPPTAAN